MNPKVKNPWAILNRPFRDGTAATQHSREAFTSLDDPRRRWNPRALLNKERFLVAGFIVNFSCGKIELRLNFG